MTTIVYPPRLIGRTRTVQKVAHLLTDADCDAIVGRLAEQGIPVAMSHGPGNRVNLRALIAVTTEQEVQALRIVAALTDSRIVWHKAVTPC